MVQFSMAEKTKQLLVEQGVAGYNLVSYPMEHTVIPEEIQKGGEFLKSILPSDDSFNVKEKEPEEMSVKELKAAIRAGGLGNKAVGLCEKSEFVDLLKEHNAAKK